MMKAHQLLRRAATQSFFVRGPLAGTRYYVQNSRQIRPHYPSTYKVSNTVLDIDAADNEHVVPILRKVLHQLPIREIKSLLLKEGAEDIPSELFSKEGACWISKNSKYFREVMANGLVGAGQRPEGVRHACSSIIDSAIRQLGLDGLPMDVGLCALALHMIPFSTTGDIGLYLRRVGHLMEEIRSRGFIWNLQRGGPTIYTLFLQDQRGGCVKQELVTSDKKAIQRFICLLPKHKRIAAEMIPPVRASIRDLIQSKDQYMEYLQMLLTMGGRMNRQLREEWLLEKDGEWLSELPFELAVAMVAAFAHDSPIIAANIVDKWAVVQGRRASDFLPRFHTEFDILMQTLHWEDQQSVKAGVNACLLKVRDEPPSGAMRTKHQTED